MSSQGAGAPSCTLSLYLFPPSLSRPSPLPFRCAFINYVGFLMISALLLSRVLSPAPSTFSASSLFFRWQVHIFLSHPSHSSFLSSLSLSHSSQAALIRRSPVLLLKKKANFLLLLLLQKEKKVEKKKKTFLHLHVGLAAGNCREVRRGLRIDRSLKNAAFHFTFFFHNFSSLFSFP